MTSLTGDRIFGTLAPGQMVTILEEQLPVDRRGIHYTLARIELDRPVHLTALALPRDLDVFLRHDVAIEPGASWWLAGTAMKVVAAHDRRVVIDRAGGGKEFPVTVACEDLVADPPGGRAPVTDDCQGCTPEPPLPERASSGPGVCWEKQSFEVVGPSGGKVVIDAEEGSLVRKDGHRGLVEIVDSFRHLRLWRWLPLAALKSHCEERLIAIGNLCSLKGGVDEGLHGAVLDAAAPLALAPGASPATTLPAGTAVVWDQERNGLRRVLVRWPNADWSGDWTLQLVGFVPAATLRRAPTPKRAKWFLGMPDWAAAFPAPASDGGVGPDGPRPLP